MMIRVELEGVAVEGGRLSIWRAERAMVFRFFFVLFALVLGKGEEEEEEE